MNVCMYVWEWFDLMYYLHAQKAVTIWENCEHGDV